MFNWALKQVTDQWTDLNNHDKRAQDTNYTKNFVKPILSTPVPLSECIQQLAVFSEAMSNKS